LPPGCRYVPADLLPFDPATRVVDLNDGGFPEGTCDVAVVLDVIEFVHDPLALLHALGGATSHLVISYRPADGGTPQGRRRLGYFNDFSSEEFEALLQRAGWGVGGRIDAAGLCLFDCRRG
jgi:hypothetical protein